jgi:hypothetical protein
MDTKRVSRSPDRRILTSARQQRYSPLVRFADEVFIDGHGPYRFLFDTGAETNQIEASPARHLGLKADFRTELDAIAGCSRVAAGQVGKTALGPLESFGQVFLFTGLEGVHAPEIRGILGQEFLSRFDYTLDFHNRRIVFAEPSHGTEDFVPPDRAPDGHPDQPGPTRPRLRNRRSDPLPPRPQQGSEPPRRRRPLSVSTVAFAQPNGRKDGLLPATLFRSIYISNSQSYIIPE